MPRTRSRKSSKSPLVHAGEWVTIALVVFSPWNFASVTAHSQLILHFFLLLLTLLYALETVVNRDVRWIYCPIGILLAALLIWSVVQTLPLPESVLDLSGPYRSTLWRELLPETPEELSPARPIIAVPAGTIAVDPFAARTFAMRVLYLFAFYSILRNAVASREFLQKLAYACLANVAALSVVGMGIYFSAMPKRALGIKDVDVSPFGPFINRDHFAFYANLCLGLGFGLLSSDSGRGKSVYVQEGAEAGKWRDVLYGGVGEVFAILLKPRSFWIVGLGLVSIAATILTQCRGAYIAAFSAVIVCAAVRLRYAFHRSPFS